jgi:hypothetical protein
MSQFGISIIDVVSVLLLVLGSEIYGFDAEPPMEPIANYSSAPAGPGSNQFNYNVEIIPQFSDTTHNNSSSSSSSGINSSNSNKVKPSVRL